MKYKFDKRFVKDLKNLKDRNLKSEITFAIDEIREVISIDNIAEIKLLEGYNNFYRIRISNFRIGCRLQKDGTLLLIRFLHRSIIYQNFP